MQVIFDIKNSSWMKTNIIFQENIFLANYFLENNYNVVKMFSLKWFLMKLIFDKIKITGRKCINEIVIKNYFSGKMFFFYSENFIKLQNFKIVTMPSNVWYNH